MKNKLFLKAVSVLSALVLIFTIIYFAGLSVAKTLYPLRYDDFVESYTEKYKLEKSFVFAVIKCESGYDNKAVSPVGARGLMQLMPETFLWLLTKTDEKLTEEDLFNPEINIKYGCMYYGMMKKQFKNTETAVAAYHAGTGNVTKWLSDKRYSSDGKTLYNIPFASTKAYVERVMKTQKIYEKIYDLTEE